VLLLAPNRRVVRPVGRLQRAALCEQARDLVADDILASMTRTATRPERIARERGIVAT
jgi:hypothetical protein